jgi:hypothetical protein
LLHSVRHFTSLERKKDMAKRNPEKYIPGIDRPLPKKKKLDENHIEVEPHVTHNYFVQSEGTIIGETMSKEEVEAWEADTGKTAVFCRPVGDGPLGVKVDDKKEEEDRTPLVRTVSRPSSSGYGWVPENDGVYPAVATQNKNDGVDVTVTVKVTTEKNTQ